MTRRTCRLAASTLIIMLTQLSQAGNLIQNPSFEAGPYGLNANPPGWTIEAGLVDVSGPGFEGAPMAASSGVKFCELVGTPEVGMPGLGRIAQTVSTIPGKKYVIAGSFSRHYGLANFWASLNVHINGQVVRVYSHSAPDISEFHMKWRRFRFLYTATTAQTTIAFSDSTSSYANGGANVDDVVVIDADELPNKRCPGKQRGNWMEDLLCDDESMSAEYDLACGNLLLQFEDPVPTRGYPLKNILSLNSSDYESNKGLGNFTFSYDIRLRKDQLIANEAGEVSRKWVLYDGDGTMFVCGSSEAAAYYIEPGDGFFGRFYSTGQPLRHILDRAGPPGQIEQAGTFTYEFDQTGKLIKLSDGLGGSGQILTYAGGVLQRVLDVDTGKSIDTEIINGRITKFIENGGSIITSLAYSGGRVTSVSVAFGGLVSATHQFSYDVLGRPASIVRDGSKESRITIAYARAGITDPVAPLYRANVKIGEHSTGAKWGLPDVMPDRPEALRAASKATSKGVTFYQMDVNGRIVGVKHPVQQGQATGKITKVAYDPSGLVSEVIDDVSISSWNYNGDGQLVGLVVDDVFGQFRNRYQLAYHVNRQLRSVRDDLGAILEIDYADPLNWNRPTAFRDATGQEWNLAYNSFGQVASLLEPGGIAPTRLEYWDTGANIGLLSQLTNASGDQLRVLSYNLAGDPTEIETSPFPGQFNRKQLAYDALHRLSVLTHDDGHSYRWKYLGRYLDETIDEAGTSTRYTHCVSCGKMVGISGPLGWKLGWTHDGDGDLRIFTDARGNATKYTYGQDRELTRVTYPDGSTINWTYGLYVHPQGRSDKRQNARGQRTETFYDQQGRVKRNEHLNSGFAGEHFEYNVDGTLKTAVEGGNFISDSFPIRRFTYWPNRIVRTETYKNASWGLNTLQTVEYDYNPDRTVSQMRWKTGDTVACAWNYSYDGAGRLSGISTNLGDGATFGYDGEGKLISQVNQNGTSRSLSYYEPRGWVSSATDRKAAQTIGSYAVQFDGGQNTVGNITQVTDNLGNVVNYTYDPLYRLTGETHTGGSAYQRTYAYDLAGNLTQVNGNSVATYDAANKIATVIGGTVTHDADGNLTAISGPGITPYSSAVFNDFDDLRSFSVNGKLVQYRYDYKGKRTVKIVNGVAESFFIYSGDQLIGEVNRDGTIRSVYTWGADGLICQRSGADVRYFHYGPQGEVRQVSDGTGNVVGRLRYNAYGVPLEVTGSVSASVRFGGKYGYYNDADSGMIRCGARWYSPELTRWISRDPSGYEGGSNLYGYARANPLRYVDSDGRESKLISRLLPSILWEPAVIFDEEREAHPGGGLSDAIRHAEASRRICEKYGEDTARYLGILNELLNFSNTWPEATMDLYNNEVGIEAAKRKQNINLDKLLKEPVR